MTTGNPDLSGKILLAHPNLRDPNFRRAIIFLTSHVPQEGALGFIINRPINKTFIPEDFAENFSENKPSKFYYGGPVGMDQVILTSLIWHPSLRKTEIYHSRPDDKSDNFSSLDPARVIAILGYTGWSPGQLEHEIGHNSWILSEPDIDLTEADVTTWKTLVARVGPRMKLLAAQPDDPSLN